MTRRIAHFSVHRSSLTIGLFYAVLGLIFSPFFLASDQGRPCIALVLPFGFGAAGYVMIAAYCLLYNFVARWTGGIEFREEAASGR
jgi:prepilin signal peptidase PulO-like enzyme (type II secretory pathway)